MHLLLLLALLDPTEIMRLVGENQDRAQQARTQFVYEEHTHRTMRNKHGKLLQEEYRVYAVTPNEKTTARKLVSIRGKCWKKGRLETYTQQHVCDGLLNITLDDDENPGNKDGVDDELFPLTTSHQSAYDFQLAGERTIRGRPAYRIQFRPRNRKDFGWTGEALVDQEEFEPVSIYTQLSRRLPAAVRTLLGVDVPGLGFSIQYIRLDKDVWFPSTFGTEFGLHALFLINRTFTENTENTNFRRTTVESRVVPPQM